MNYPMINHYPIGFIMVYHIDFEPYQICPRGHEFIAIGSGQRRRFMAKYSRTVL